MTAFPQLRTRSEYSFRSAYGSPLQIAEAARAAGATHCGMVDTSGTWGHVAWEKAVLKNGIEPLFGAEFSLLCENGRKQTYWALAKSLPAFYKFSSNPPETEQEIAARKEGLIIFAGAALKTPEAIDYIDINPRSRMRTEHALALAKKINRPVVITSDPDFPCATDRERFLAWDNSSKMTPQHILSLDESRAALWYVSSDIFAAAIESTKEAAEAATGCRMRRAPIIHLDGDLQALAIEGKDFRLSRGHIKEWTQEYNDRLARELAMIKSKDFESYFLVVADMISWAKKHMLVGPGRGSSAGSLVCYLLGITEIDPLVHGLVFERFIDVTRLDLPDIDSDFNDQKREQVFVYLAEKYGKENTSRIGSVNRLKPRSVIAHVSKKLGIPIEATYPLLNVLIEYKTGDARFGKELYDTLTTTKPGKDFLEKYPEAILMAELEGHASHSGVHAAGFIVSNEPVTEYCTVRDGIAQIDKKDAETLNLLKMDILGLRTLGVMEDASCITAQELYDLPLDDPEVFRIFNDHKFSCLFQFEGAAQRKISSHIPVVHFRQIDHITALARPGPMGSGATEKYTARNSGKTSITYCHPSMGQYLDETNGIILYQEQVMKLAHEIGNLSWGIVSELRSAMSKSKGAEYFDKRGAEFIAGAMSQGISQDDAQEIWSEMVSFGGWGMNKSHTVSYAAISYWCAYLKRYHAVKYAAACLRNAKDDEQTIELLREMRDEGVPFVAFDAEKSDIDWQAVGGTLLGGYKNLVGIGPVKAARYVASKPLNAKDRAAIGKCALKFSDLTPAHSLWGDIYQHPGDYRVNGQIKQLAFLDDLEECVVICQLISLNRRDENEQGLINRRGGKVNQGQTLFLDMFVVDDSASKPVRMRLKPWQWESFGEHIAEKAIPKKDWFLVRGKWLEKFSMFAVDKIKCLSNKELFT